MLHLMPVQSERQVLIIPSTDEANLQLLNMPTASFWAHKSGLQECVAGYTGLVSVGALGSIMAWPEADLRNMAQDAGLAVPGRCAL